MSITDDPEIITIDELSKKKTFRYTQKFAVRTSQGIEFVAQYLSYCWSGRNVVSIPYHRKEKIVSVKDPVNQNINADILMVSEQRSVSHTLFSQVGYYYGNNVLMPIYAFKFVNEFIHVDDVQLII